MCLIHVGSIFVADLLICCKDEIADDGWRKPWFQGCTANKPGRILLHLESKLALKESLDRHLQKPRKPAAAQAPSACSAGGEKSDFALKFQAFPADPSRSV